MTSSKAKSSVVVVGLLLGLLLSAGACGTQQVTAGMSTATGSARYATYQATATLGTPITTGHVIEPLSGLPPDLAAYGYEEQEFFASGTATAFSATSAPSDGRWSIAPAASASY